MADYARSSHIGDSLAEHVRAGSLRNHYCEEAPENWGTLLHHSRVHAWSIDLDFERSFFKCP